MAEAKTTKTKKKLTPYKPAKTQTTAPVESEVKPPFKIKRSYMIILLAVLVVIALIYLLRSFFVVALVNGEPITRLQVIDELETQGGKQITESLITESLIRQQAREKGIQATQDELNKEIASLEELYKQQGQELSQVLEMRGMTREDLVSQIELKIFLDKLVGTAEVTDEEVQQFIDENNEAYGGTLTPEDVRAQLEEQKKSEKSQQFITDLQKNAKIQYFVNY